MEFKNTDNIMEYPGMDQTDQTDIITTDFMSIYDVSLGLKNIFLINNIMIFSGWGYLQNAGFCKFLN